MSAYSIFKNVIDEGWPGVLTWADEKTEESLHLEFKAKDRDNLSAMTDKDRGQLAQGMSAFANSEGGVYVLGVHAISQGKNFPDQVRSILPLTNVLSQKGSIQKRVYELTDPPIAGVRVEHIDSHEAPGSGVIVIYIPQSDAGPHRVITGPDAVRDRYYMRSTLSTIPMHHALLAEKFGRRPMAQLYLAVVHRLARPRCSAEVWIGNSGRGYAERPAVAFVQNPDPQQIESSPDVWWHLLKPAKGWDTVVLPAGARDGIGCIVRAGAETVLYPGMEMLLGFIEDDREIYRSSYRLSVHGLLYALNTQPARFSYLQDLPVSERVSDIHVGRVDIPVLSPRDPL